MYKNKYWLILLSVVFITAFSYTIFACYKVYQFQRLSVFQHPLSISWHIEKINEDLFQLKGDYQFSWKGQLYTGSAPTEDLFLNEWSAKNNLSKNINVKREILFDPSNPNYSVLFKNFPYKSVFYVFVLWGLLFYFIFIGQKVNQYLGIKN